MRVRKTSTDPRGSHIADLVALEIQERQRGVRSACDQKTMKFHKILPQYTNKMYKNQ